MLLPAAVLVTQAPPHHMRQDSWEMAWGDDDAGEQQPQVSARHVQNGPATSSHTPATGERHAVDKTAVSPLANRPGILQAAVSAHDEQPGEPISTQGTAVSMQAKSLTGAVSSRHGPSPVAIRKQLDVTPVSAAPTAMPPSCSSNSKLATQGAASSELRVATSHPVIHSGGVGLVPGKTSTLHSCEVGPSDSSRQPQEAPEVAALSTAAAVERVLAAEAAQLPLIPVALLLAMFAAVLVTSMFSKLVPCGSAAYWLIQTAVAPTLMGVWWYSRHMILAKVALKKTAQLDFHGEVRWTPKKVCGRSGHL